MKETSFWVQIYYLPLLALNKYIGRTIRVSLVRVEKVDLEYREIKWGEFMTIRVSIDITKPILQWKRLNIGLVKQSGRMLQNETSLLH